MWLGIFRSGNDRVMLDLILRRVTLKRHAQDKASQEEKFKWWQFDGAIFNVIENFMQLKVNAHCQVRN
jgi:hypothetical protein